MSALFLHRGPAPAAGPAAFDKTRFLGWYEAKTVGNTSGLWKDSSGHAKDLTRSDTAWSIVNDGTRLVYRTGGGVIGWTVPDLSTVAQDYTVYAYMKATNLAGVGSYLLDFATDRCITAFNDPDGTIYSGTWALGTNNIATTSLIRATWRLNHLGAALWVNNAVIASGGAYTACRLMAPSAVGSFYGGTSKAFMGDLVAWGIAPGNDTDAQLSATDQYLLTL
ncbi:MAG: hypothetical protein NVS3B25_34130 [Hymenobacter sp.]